MVFIKCDYDNNNNNNNNDNNMLMVETFLQDSNK